MKPLLLAVLLILAVIAAGCGLGNLAGDAPVEDKKDIVVIETNVGTIEIQINRENAPITAENFLRYVEEGFYNGTIFHRVIRGFMIQGGGFTVDGKEKPVHDAIKLESDNSLKNERGSIAMARTSEPDSATCQFFINLVDNDFLDRAPGRDGYAVFGKVVSGMEVVDRIGEVETADSPLPDWPKETIMIERAYLKDI